MVAIPATGGTFVQAGFNDRGPEFLRRGNPVAVLCRDARGAATDISPHNPDGSTLFSPFALDNTWRTDLLAVKKSGGYYTTNLTANEGFFNLGAFKDGDGPAWKPGVKNDHFMILQDNFPYDTMLTDESEPFSLTPVDTASPWVQRLRNNRPYSDAAGASLMEDPGLSGAGFSRLLSGANPGRQFLFIRERMWNGLPIYSVQGVALARMDDIGNSKLDKKDSEGAPLTYLPLPDGRFSAVQDGSYQSILVHTWWGGAGWTALGGVPIVSATPPVATPTTTGKATVALADPTGTGDPFTFSVLKAVSPYTSWSAAAPDGASYTAAGVVVSASGTTTIKVTGVTAGPTKFEVVVTGTNGASTTSVPSNAATIT